MNKMNDFIIKIHGEVALGSFYMRPEGRIHFREEIGYIAISNYDRDKVVIHGYGKIVEEAFLNALMEYELYLSENYDWSYRCELNK